MDKLSFAPNFMILISPVISMGEYAHQTTKKNLLGANPSKELTEKYSLEKQITATTPTAFIVHAADDKKVNPRNSLLFYNAFLDINIRASLHIFPNGGHNIAVRNNPGSTAERTNLCEMWLIEMNFIPRVKNNRRKVLPDSNGYFKYQTGKRFSLGFNFSRRSSAAVRPGK